LRLQDAERVCSTVIQELSQVGYKYSVMENYPGSTDWEVHIDAPGGWPLEHMELVQGIADDNERQSRVEAERMVIS
jgi:hypothetical protein